MGRVNPLRGKSEALSNMFVNLIDEYIDQYPQTPMETVWMALEEAKRLYNPGGADQSLEKDTKR